MPSINCNWNAVLCFLIAENVFLLQKLSVELLTIQGDNLRCGNGNFPCQEKPQKQK